MTWSLSDGRVSTTLSSTAEQNGQRMAQPCAPRVWVMLAPLMNDLQVTVNGEIRTTPRGTTVASLLADMGVDPARVAVEKNRDVVPRRTWGEAPVADGDHIEIVSFIGGGSDASLAPAGDPLVIA